MHSLSPFGRRQAGRTARSPTRGFSLPFSLEPSGADRPLRSAPLFAGSLRSALGSPPKYHVGGKLIGGRRASRNRASAWPGARFAPALLSAARLLFPVAAR